MARGIGVGTGKLSGSFGGRTSVTYEKSPEEKGRERAREKLAESQEIARAREMVRFQVPDPTRGALATKVVWAMRGSPPENGTEISTENGNFGLGFTNRSAWRQQFQRRDVNAAAEAASPVAAPPAPRDALSAFGEGLRREGLHPTAKAVAPAALTPFSTTPADARAIAERYGNGAAETYQPKGNELFQPVLKDEKGDRTASVLPKVPGTDPRLDPVYAAKVFRDAGDIKTAEAYEAHAATIDPARYVTKGGAPFVNPFFKPATAPATASEPGYTPAPTAEKVLPSTVYTAPTEATVAGQRVRQMAGAGYETVADATIRPFGRKVVENVVQPALDTGRMLGGLMGDTVRGAQTAAANTKDFITGVTQELPGSNATVSRATAAQFQKPTKENPLPITPTTPIANIDKAPESIDLYEPDEERAWDGF